MQIAKLLHMNGLRVTFFIIFFALTRGLALAAEASNAKGQEANKHLEAGNAALLREDYTTANSEWTECLLKSEDPNDKVAEECYSKLNVYKNRHTKLDLPKAEPRIPLARVLIAPLPTAGLSGAKLREARLQNMYEAFLDCKELQKSIDELKTQESTPLIQETFARWRTNLEGRRKDLQNNEAFFSPEDRVADVRESFSEKTRNLVVTFVNSKQLKVTRLFHRLSRGKKVGVPSENLPDLNQIHNLVKEASDAVDKIDQPVGETDEQRRRRLGLKP